MYLYEIWRGGKCYSARPQNRTFGHPASSDNRITDQESREVYTEV